MKHLLFLFTIAVFFSSCEGDEYVTYRFTSLDAENANTSVGLPFVSNVDSVSKEVYALRLFLHPIQTSRKGRYFDLLESSVVAENPIEKIVITSSDSFDISHPAGTNLNNYFVHLMGNYMNVSDPIPLDGKISPIAKYNDNYAEQNFPEYADLLLIHYPDNLVSRKFCVKLTMKGGGVWVDSTASIKLY